LKNSEFLKNIFVLFSGTLISQLLPFILLPIFLKYFYSLSDFGILAIFIASADLLARVATLKLEFGIVLQARLKNAINLVSGALRNSWFVALVSFGVILLFKAQIAQYIGEPKLENLLLLIPVYILVSAINDVSTFWFNRSKNFKLISFGKITQTTSNELSKLVFGFFGWGFIGLIVSRIIGLFVSNFYFLNRFFNSNKKSLRLLNKTQRKKIVFENRAYMYFSTPSVFVAMLINFVYLNLFLVYFGSEIVGSINISMIYISAGYGMLSLSFSQVYYSKLSEINDKETLLKTYKKFGLNLFILGFLPVIAIYLIPNGVISQLLGEKWIQLFEIIRIMSLWLSVWFVSSSLSFIYMKLGKQKVMMFYDLLHLALVCIGFFVGFHLGNSFFSALWGFTIAQICYYLFVIFLAIRFIKQS
jgi:lipopolysaccharide exporter